MSHFFERIKQNLVVLVMLSALNTIAQNQWQIFNVSNTGIANDRVNCITPRSNGEIWFGTNGGITVYDNGTWANYTPNNSTIYNATVTEIFFDDIGNTWVGFATGGMALFDGNIFSQINLEKQVAVTPFFGTNDVRAFEKDSSNNLYIGTRNGLIIKSGNNYSYYKVGNGIYSDQVYSLKYNKDKHRMWVGTFDGGLLEFDINSHSFINQYFVHNPTDPFIGGWQQVNAITYDTEGDIWITGLGVIEYDKNTMAKKSEFSSNNGLGDPLVWGIAFDKTNGLWVGSDCLDGVFLYSNGTWITYNETNSGFPKDICYYVYDFYIDDHNSVWMAHGSQGIIKYNQALTEIKEFGNMNINLYPNPVDNIINVEIDDFESVSLVIYDNLGRSVKKIEPINHNKTQINISSLKSGSYYLQIIKNDKVSIHKQFIINK